MKFFTTIIIMIMSLQMQAMEDSLAVKTIEGITDKMLEILSGPIGEARDWDSYRNLFLPTAQKVSINKRAPNGKQVRTMNIEEFIRNVGPLYARDGFEEYATGLTVHQFNGIATAFQSFYCRNLTGTYENKGINCYQLVYDADRWWIASTSFANETEEHKVPEQYLKK